MISAVIATALLVPVMAPAQVPASVSVYRDSGHHVWDTTPKWIRELGACIRQHESHHNYRAKNPVSTAAGAYQFINATWRGNAKWVDGAEQYRTAGSAPAHVQDKVFIHSIRQGGIDNWRGTGCKGTE